ncbi:MAG TPA: thiamine pyrophosphate-dependent dehydrogenase E1 component subunit alpha [Clostridiaceae bacterium]|nr:thiamine pyrophosphate-dependent dehydrogenase E1 component subunit alpha [Clostridiaceae bacterium]
MDLKLRIKMFRDMYTIRVFEEKVRVLAMQNKLPGFFHLYVGEEAIAVGVCSALNKDDYITSTHRGHGHLIAKGGDINKAMAELYGKATGYNKGKGGSMHIAAPELGILGTNGIVGGGIPIATGAALSAKYKKDGRVAVAFFGDGASNQGTFHEAINIGAAFNLPVIYVCENNLYGVSTRQTTVRKVEDIAVRAQAYGIPGVIVDGTDPDEVYKVAKEAVDRARRGEGPTLIECKTYKHHTHFVGDTDSYMNKEELEAWKKKDPIAVYPKRLIEEGIIDEDGINQIKKEVEEAIEKAIEFSENSPDPRPESALEDVYAD